MAVPTSLSNLLDALPNSENKLDVLGDIKLIVNSMNANNVRESVRNVSFNVIFECLDTTDSEQIRACCDVLDKLLSASDAMSVVNTFHRELLLGLGHPSDTVQRLTLNQLLRGARASSQQVLHTDVITAMVNTLGSESLDIVQKSAQILTILAMTPEGLEVLFHAPVIDQFNNALQQGDIVAYRVFEELNGEFYNSVPEDENRMLLKRREWIVDVCMLGHEALNCCTAAGLLQRLINDLHKDDVLIQLNCIDMLSKMAVSLHGLQYLERQGVVHTLEGMMEGVDSDPMMHFLLPGLLKFFGQVGHRHPRKVCERFPRFMSTLLTMVEDDSDASLQNIAVETVGFIGHTVEGKHALAKHNHQINEVCKKMGQVLSSDAASQRRIRFLVALSNLLYLDLAEQTTELLATTESWFYHISSDPLSVLMKLAQQPFVEIHTANLELLDVLASQPWAQKLMNNYAGFKEFLLDRSTEKTKEGKEAKYKVVRTLVNSPTTLDVFGRVYMMKMREYHNEGPFYVTVESAVDYEEAS